MASNRRCSYICSCCCLRFSILLLRSSGSGCSVVFVGAMSMMDVAGMTDDNCESRGFVKLSGSVLVEGMDTMADAGVWNDSERVDGGVAYFDEVDEPDSDCVAMGMASTHRLVRSFLVGDEGGVHGWVHGGRRCCFLTLMGEVRGQLTNLYCSRFAGRSPKDMRRARYVS